MKSADAIRKKIEDPKKPVLPKKQLNFGIYVKNQNDARSHLQMPEEYIHKQSSGENDI